MEISRLQYITTNAIDAEKACMGGVRWVQLRVKDKAEDEWRNIAIETRKVCSKYGATLIVNDNLKIALEAGANGVHLGKDDMDPAEARKRAGNGFIIGGTANTIDDVRSLNARGVNYIGLGPFRFTSTKANLSPVLGLRGYENLLELCSFENIVLPIVAIGGIGLADIDALMNTGIYGIAVSSAISDASDISFQAKKFIEEINQCDYHEKRFVNYSR